MGNGRSGVRGILEPFSPSGLTANLWYVYHIHVAKPEPLLAAFLRRLGRCLDDGSVVVTFAAAETVEEQFGWDEGDIFALLLIVDADDFDHRVSSSAEEGGAIWVFLPMTAEGRIWLRLCERESIIVVSLHRG